MGLFTRNSKGPFTKKLNKLEKEAWDYFKVMVEKKKKNFTITFNGVIDLSFDINKRTITEKNKWCENEVTYTYEEWYESKSCRSVSFIVELADELRKVF